MQTHYCFSWLILASFVQFCGHSNFLASPWSLQSCLTKAIKWENHTISFISLWDRSAYLLSKSNLSHHRYSIKVTVAQCITIQVRTSKPDAFIKLQVLESEETMVSTLGKGQAIIPAFYFLGSERALSSQCKYLPGVWAACMNRRLCCCGI